MPLPRPKHRGRAVRCRALILGALVALGLAATTASAAKPRPLELRHQRIELPGPPAAMLDPDLDGDGRRDLLVLVAYTEIEPIGIDRIEDMVQISTVIPALFDRREARAFLRASDGTLREVGGGLRLEGTLLAVARGPREETLLALTDDGVSLLRFEPGPPPRLVLAPLIAEPPVMRGAGSFFSALEWTVDLDGDGARDVVFPGQDGLAIFRATAAGLAATPSQRLPVPIDRRGAGRENWRRYPFPTARDVTGDGRLDLVWSGRRRVDVLAGGDDGRFRPVNAGRADCPAAESALVFGDGRGDAAGDEGRDPAGNDAVPDEGAEARDGVGAEGWLGRLAYFGDLDGVGPAELVTVQELRSDKDGFGAEMREAKRPRNRYRVHHLRDDLTIDARPAQDFVVEGHSFEDMEIEAAEIQQFQDLDGDGRKDLITVTLDFSVLQVFRVLATKKISVGLDFHVWAQQPDGSFREVPGLDLSEKLRFDLDDLKLGRLAQFKGDFDGDGRIDFVHLGRGREVTIHLGQPGCRYPTRPDLTVKLEEAPQDLGLVRVEDLDGDGRADLAVTRLLPQERDDVSPAVLVDLYLSGDGR